MSFNPHSVAAIGALEPTLPLGADDRGVSCTKTPRIVARPTIRCHLRDIPDFDRVECASFISHDVRMIWTILRLHTPEGISGCRYPVLDRAIRKRIEP